MENDKIEVSNEQLQPDGSFSMKMSRTTYQIGIHFSKTSKKSLNDKVKRLMKKDVMAESSKLKIFANCKRKLRM